MSSSEPNHYHSKIDNILLLYSQLLAKTVSGVFHSLKTALPSFESSDTSTAGESAGSLGVNGGAGGDGMLKSKSGGVLSERNKLAAFLSSGNKAEYELKLDITAEEEVTYLYELCWILFGLSFQKPYLLFTIL